MWRRWPGAGDVPRLLVGVAWWLSGTNLLLGVFNLLPGAPLDGGRILRAWLWHRHGDRVRATIGASRAGQLVAFLLVGLGLLEFVTGAGINGLWMVFIGWFLLSAARAEEADVTMRQLLSDVLVRDVMTSQPRTAPAWFTVDEFIQRYVLGAPHSAYPIASLDGTIEGLVTLAQLRQVPADERTSTRIGDRPRLRRRSTRRHPDPRRHLQSRRGARAGPSPYPPRAYHLVTRAGSGFTVSFGNDRVGVSGPDEGLAAFVPAVDELVDRVDEFADRAEGAVSDGLAGGDPEEDLDHV